MLKEKKQQTSQFWWCQWLQWVIAEKIHSREQQTPSFLLLTDAYLASKGCLGVSLKCRHTSADRSLHC